MPKVAIDARPLAGGYRGYTSYLISIIEPLLEAGFDITLLTNEALNPAHEVVKRCRVEQFGSAKAWAWEQVDVPRYLDREHHDIYLVGTNKGLPWRKRKGTRYILALLDVIPFKFPRIYLKPHYIVRELRPVSFLISIVRADELITISEASARDVQAIFHRPAKALLMWLPPLKPQKTEPKKQFFYVGGVDARKRVDVLLVAFAEFSKRHPDYHLVLIGKGYEVFNDLVGELKLKDKVTMTGYVDEDTKMRLIGESQAFVYPSLYEGYGLVIAEGFQAGVPGIAGPGGSQAEIGGEGVIYIDPTRPADVDAAMEQILDPQERAKLEAGMAQQVKKLFGSHIAKAIADYFSEQARKAGGND
jgi:glycosyltransferase involved in cell wall biosynthesis